MISREMSMSQALIDHPLLITLFPRFQMKLGFGDLSVEEVCTLHRVKTDFFLEIANAYLDESFVPAEGMDHFSLGTVVNYIRGTHAYFLESALPMAEEKLLRLLEKSSLNRKKIDLVREFFDDYKKEFLEHIAEEEDHILPYILELEKQSDLPRPDEKFIEKLSTYSINEYEQEHERLETSLENLSRLIIKNLPPFDDFQLCKEVLHDLTTLVKDLEDHADMEDKILVPRVADLEKQLLDQFGSP